MIDSFEKSGRGDIVYKIRKATIEDMPFIIDMAAKEGWNPGLSDGGAFFAADDQGFFIGELDGEPISCISGVSYGDFGFVGLYIVKEEHRKKGYGIQIWHEAMDYLGDINNALDGVPAEIGNYQKSGFVLYHRNLRYEGMIKEQARPCEYIVPAAEVDFKEIEAFDRKYFPAKRTEFLKQWLSAQGHNALVWQENGEILGLGVIRKCGTGFKIGQLFAESPDIAEALFLSLAEFAQGEPVFFDIIEGNPGATEIVSKYGMTKMFETARMYTKGQPQIQWNNIYGITTFELG